MAKKEKGTEKKKVLLGEGGTAIKIQNLKSIRVF